MPRALVTFLSALPPSLSPPTLCFCVLVLVCPLSMGKAGGTLVRDRPFEEHSYGDDL